MGHGYLIHGSHTHKQHASYQFSAQRGGQTIHSAASQNIVTAPIQYALSTLLSYPHQVSNDGANAFSVQLEIFSPSQYVAHGEVNIYMLLMEKYIYIYITKCKSLTPVHKSAPLADQHNSQPTKRRRLKGPLGILGL